MSVEYYMTFYCRSTVAWYLHEITTRPIDLSLGHSVIKGLISVSDFSAFLRMPFDSLWRPDLELAARPVGYILYTL